MSMTDDRHLAAVDEPTEEEREVAAAMEGTPEEDPPGEAGAEAGRQTLADLAAAAPDVAEEDDGQLFVWEQGTKVTLGTLIKRGTAVEYAIVFGGKRVKGGSTGLIGFGEKPRVIVRCGVGPVKVVPTYDDDEKIKSVVVEQHFVAKLVADADSEDGLTLIADVLDKHGYVQSAP